MRHPAFGFGLLAMGQSNVFLFRTRSSLATLRGRKRTATCGIFIRDRPIAESLEPRADCHIKVKIGEMRTVYRYREDVLDELVKHGVRPRPTTPPALVMEFISDLYRYEIRRLRQRLMRKEFPQREYAARVIDLRKQYPLVSLPTRLWTEPASRSR